MASAPPTAILMLTTTTTLEIASCVPMCIPTVLLAHLQVVPHVQLTTLC